MIGIILIILLSIYGVLGSCLTYGWLMLFYFGTEKVTYNYFTTLDIVRLSLPFISIVLAALLIFKNILNSHQIKK